MLICDSVATLRAFKGHVYIEPRSPASPHKDWYSPLAIPMPLCAWSPHRAAVLLCLGKGSECAVLWFILSVDREAPSCACFCCGKASLHYPLAQAPMLIVSSQPLSVFYFFTEQQFVAA